MKSSPPSARAGQAPLCRASTCARESSAAVGIDDGTFRSAFSVSATGTLAHRAGTAGRRQLVWVDRAGKVVAAIGAPDESTLAHPALAPDGQRVAVTRLVQGNLDLWLMDVSRGVAVTSPITIVLNWEAALAKK